MKQNCHGSILVIVDTMVRPEILFLQFLIEMENRNEVPSQALEEE